VPSQIVARVLADAKKGATVSTGPCAT
jgi:hypothetical protein